MKKRACIRYSSELKNQIIKEVLDTGKIAIVARNHKLPHSTLATWMKQYSSTALNNQTDLQKRKDSNLNFLQLKKKLADAELENRVLKELLKKTNQAWLRD